MNTKLGLLVTGLVVSVAMLAAACSGDESGPSAEELANDPANAPIEQIDAGSGGVASGPIAGLLTVQPSFGFGVFDVDRATGAALAVPGIASIETVDRNRDVIVSNGAAYSLGAKVREGQTFASDISIVKIDYVTGQVSRLAPLGFDRETDDSATVTVYRLEAVAGDSVLVSSGEFGSDETTFTVFDADTGDEKASFPTPVYEFSSDGGSCTGRIGHLIGLRDGRVTGIVLGSPAILDLDSGDIELLIGCDEDTPQLADFVPVADVADFAVFAAGAAPTSEQFDRLLMSDINPEWGFVEGDGDLWWIEADTRQVDDQSVIVGGVVQFDIDDAQVEAVYPLGAHLGEFVECEEEGGTCQLSTLEQADLRWFDGRLVMLDARENGRLFTLDPTTDTLTVTELERGDGVDYTSAELLEGDPNAIWLEVTRFTITQDDDSGRSAAGPTFIEHFDPESNQIDLSLAADDLFS